MTAHGTRDEQGRWHADDPGAYPPMDVHGTLPWSVLRADSAGWQARRKHWAGLGVDDTGPRAHAPAMIATGRHGAVSGGVSRFDPHLAECLLTWFAPPGGAVLDPFAGGPVRGLVAGALGHPYTGVELSEAQVAANRERAAGWQERGLLATGPVWVHGDAAQQLPGMAAGSADYVLTCPPYHNRERYSHDPRDLSAMRWAEFGAALAGILAAACAALRPDRFATVVISDVRDHRGHLRGLPSLAADALRGAGLHLANEQILIEPGGLRAKTMRPAWTACRTTTRTHQVVLTAVKGDRRAAAAAARRGPGAA